VGTAVLTLVGVVVGAAGTGWVTFLLNRRAEHAELREARRLVALEIGAAAVDLVGVAETPKYKIVEDEALRALPLWMSERRILVRRLDDHTWELLAVFFLRVAALKQLIRVRGDRALSSEQREGARSLAQEGNVLGEMLQHQPIP
jgi:hypothetical protein